MQTTRTVRPAGLMALAALTLALVVVGCSATNPIPLPGASGPLLTVTSRGGECFAAPCGTSIIVERDGRVHQAAKPPNDLGKLTPEQLIALDAAIKTTDFAVIKSHPFTGECPTSFDGQAFTFEFGAPNGIQRIDTCEVEVDFGQPVFVATSTALGAFMALPTT